MQEAKHEDVVVGRYRRSGKPLGSGGFGSVYVCSIEGEVALQFAVKILHLHRLSREQILSEARKLSELKHLNIIALRDVVFHGAETWMIMEHCLGGSLADLTEPPPAEVFTEIIKQTLRGIAYLHGQVPTIQHMDIKPANICLLNPLTDCPCDVGVKLVDFGAADMVVGSIYSERPGTRAFFSPERWRNFAEGRMYHYDHSDDMWAAGVSLLLVAEGCATTKAVESELQAHAVTCFSTDVYWPRLETLLDKCSTRYGARVAQVLRGLLAAKAKERLSADSALKKLDVPLQQLAEFTQQIEAIPWKILLEQALEELRQLHGSVGQSLHNSQQLPVADAVDHALYGSQQVILSASEDFARAGEASDVWFKLFGVHFRELHRSLKELNAMDKTIQHSLQGQARERAAREQAAREQAAREQAARERAAKEQAEQEQARQQRRAAVERAAQERASLAEVARLMREDELQEVRERAAYEEQVLAARDQAARDQAARAHALQEYNLRVQLLRAQAEQDLAAREQAERAEQAERTTRQQAQHRIALKEAARLREASQEAASAVWGSVGPIRTQPELKPGYSLGAAPRTGGATPPTPPIVPGASSFAAAAPPALPPPRSLEASMVLPGV